MSRDAFLCEGYSVATRCDTPSWDILTASATAGRSARFDTQRAAVQFTVHRTGTDAGVTCPKGQISRVVLRWERSFPVDARFLGDRQVAAPPTISS